MLVLGRAAGAGADMEQRFERAVSVTATIWRLLTRRRMPARLILDHDTPPITTQDRTALIEGLDALSRVKAQKRIPLEALKAASRGTRGRTVVYVGTAEEPKLAGPLSDAAGRRGDVQHLRADLGSIRQWVGGIR